MKRSRNDTTSTLLLLSSTAFGPYWFPCSCWAALSAAWLARNWPMFGAGMYDGRSILIYTNRRDCSGRERSPRPRIVNLGPTLEVPVSRRWATVLRWHRSTLPRWPRSLRCYSSTPIARRHCPRLCALLCGSLCFFSPKMCNIFVVNQPYHNMNTQATIIEVSIVTRVLLQQPCIRDTSIPR